MHLCIEVDVRHLLKTTKKVKKPGDKWKWVNFKYERLAIDQRITCQRELLKGYVVTTPN